MPEWHPYQIDFSGGEISPRALNRIDADMYRKSCLRMLNWMPSIEGPARRSPGSAYIETIPDVLEGRVIPYLNINNERAALILTDQQLRVRAGLPGSNEASVRNVTGFRSQVLPNPEFTGSRAGWEFTPAQFSGGEGDTLGCYYRGQGAAGTLWSVCRLWKYPQDNTFCLIQDEGTVQFPTDTITLDYRIIYQDNPGIDVDNPNVDPDDQYNLTFDVSTTPLGIGDSGDVYSVQLTGPVGTISERILNLDLPVAGYTGPIYVRIVQEATAIASTPVFVFDRISILADAEAPSVDEILVSPFLEDELEDIQYVQSPYNNKEIVLVHPNHEPHWLYFDPQAVPPAYVLEPMPIVDPPSFWDTNNYPSACTAYQGRLVLGGTPLESETVVASQPGAWEVFTSNSDPITAKDGLEFTSIFRSPTTCLSGQKDLLVFSKEFEYVVKSDTGILKADDIDVRLHTTHGSSAVQPVGMGQYVAFAGERGTRLRAAQLNRDDEGWIAPDKSILASHLLFAGIKRMARMRNPHQMLMCLTRSGTIAVFHEDPYAGISGWSVIDIGGEVIDIMSQPTNSGLDVLYALVRRTNDNGTFLYLEAILDWTDEGSWRYMSSYSLFNFTTATTVVSGLDYLEGQRVDVIGDGSYLGSFKVETGQIELPRESILVEVGLNLRNTLRTLPPTVSQEVGGFGSKKRHSEIIVRVLGGTRLLINGQAPADRDAVSPQDISQPVDILRDNKITNLGWDEFATIEVRENTPFPCTVIGIFGKLASKTL